MVDVVLIHGPSGSGKSTQCARLSEALGAAHISTGELLRRHTKTFNHIADGTLANSDDILRLVGEALDQVPADQAIVLDGVARMPEEAKWLNDKLAQLGRKMSLVIELDIPEKETMSRLLNRDSSRPDDDEVGIRKRLSWYHEMVGASLEFWETQTLACTVNGVGTPDEVAARIKELVDAA
jgi:adenylate kinase